MSECASRQLEIARERIAELERERDEWRLAAGAAAARRRELTAECAAMREALENCVHEEKCSNCCQDWPPNTECQGCKGMRLKDAALSGTAGEQVAAVYRAAVAWRDSETVTDAMGVNAAALIAAVDKAQGGTK